MRGMTNRDLVHMLRSSRTARSVMPAHSRSKNGVASLVYVAGIHDLRLSRKEDVDGRDKPGHDEIRDSIPSANAL